MATTTEPRRDATAERTASATSAAAAIARSAASSSGRWLFMRISGLVLLVLAVGHVLIMHVQDDGVGRVELRVRGHAVGQPVLADVGLDAAGARAASTASTVCASSRSTTFARRVFDSRSTWSSTCSGSRCSCSARSSSSRSIPRSGRIRELR